MEKDIIKTINVDMMTVQNCTVIVDCVPKVSVKNDYLQKAFNKLFGYKLVTKCVKAKVINLSPQDCPIDEWGGELTFEL